MKTLANGWAGVGALCFSSLAFAQYTMSNPSTVASVPSDARACATDGKECDVPSGTVVIFYGVNNTFTVLRGTGRFMCLPSSLGIPDPAPNIGKTCYVKAETPSGMRACATDGKQCNVSGAWTGLYGIEGKFVAISGNGSFTCLPGNLGVADPAPNIGKTCYVNDQQAQRVADEQRRQAEATRQAEAARQAEELRRRDAALRGPVPVVPPPPVDAAAQRAAEAQRQAEAARRQQEAQRNADAQRKVAEEQARRRADAGW